MSIPYTNKFLTELKNPNRTPNDFIEIALVGGDEQWGKHKVFPRIRPVLKSVSKSHNKLDVKKNVTTKGDLTFTVAASSYIDGIIQNNRLKNLRVKKYEGFLADGWVDTDYIKVFEGVIYDFSHSNEIYTFRARDIRELTSTSAPKSETDKTQFIDYSDTNPIDIMVDLIEVQAGIPSADYDGAKFDSERDTWYNGWGFHRIITKSQPIEKYLEELQRETNGFLYHDGNKLSFKSFAPDVPGETVREFSDDYNLIAGKTSHDSGYIDQFFNRVEVHFDYDESGEDKKEENYESIVVAEDIDSQTDWDEIKTKFIKSKWIRTYKHDQPSNITGCIVYHGSKDNGIGEGTLTFNFTNQTLTLQADGDSVGSIVKVDRSGKYQIKSSDERKYIRVIIDSTATPGSNKSDTITFAALQGETYATALATRLLNRYLVPVPTIKCAVDYHDISNDGVMFTPTDVVNITTDKVTIFGQGSFIQEPCILLEVRPDERTQIINIEAIPTKLGQRGMFIAPSGQPYYEFATDEERRFWYIGRASDNKVFDGINYVRGFNSII